MMNGLEDRITTTKHMKINKKFTPETKESALALCNILKKDDMALNLLANIDLSNINEDYILEDTRIFPSKKDSLKAINLIAYELLNTENRSVKETNNISIALVNYVSSISNRLTSPIWSVEMYDSAKFRVLKFVLYNLGCANRAFNVIHNSVDDLVDKIDVLAMLNAIIYTELQYGYNLILSEFSTS